MKGQSTVEEQAAMKEQSIVKEQAKVEEQQAAMLEEAIVVTLGHGSRRSSSPSDLEFCVEVES